MNTKKYKKKNDEIHKKILTYTKIMTTTKKNYENLQKNYDTNQQKYNNLEKSVEIK